jgi:hypothetical protein
VDNWIIALLLGVVCVGFVVARVRGSRAGSMLDLGEVSQSWLTEQRADKRSDR